MEPLRYRVIASQENKQYLLTLDDMHTVNIETQNMGVSGSYLYYTLLSPALSRASVKRIFKLGRGYCKGSGGKHFFRLTPDKLQIGCQTFEGAALHALRRWVGVL